MTETAEEAKKRIRTEVIAGRARLSGGDRALRGVSLAEQMVSVVEVFGARSVSCYFPVKNEPDTRPFLDWAIKNGVEVLLPKSREDGLLDWVVYTGDSLQPGLFGIPEPVGEALSPISVGEVDVMFVPAGAVDVSGNRLGWGRGFYDKSLGSMDSAPPAFAVVYDEEVLENIPTQAHDAPVNGAVTPTRIHRFIE